MVGGVAGAAIPLSRGEGAPGAAPALLLATQAAAPTVSLL